MWAAEVREYVECEGASEPAAQQPCSCPAAFLEAGLNVTLKSFIHGCLLQENKGDEKERIQWGH